ncbi:MAG: magnesium transporter [Eubacteriales bacterium]|nr:magnesium transporter [Eubacteriales bacterium]
MTDNIDSMYIEEILLLFREHANDADLLDKLSDYHDSNIADAFVQLNEDERKALIPILLSEDMTGMFSYVDDLGDYLKELTPEQISKVIEYMDSDDVVDILEDMEEDKQKRILSLMGEKRSRDVQMILSYEEDEIGSLMTTNYILIKNNINTYEALHELTRQAGENDNISTIYVVDEEGKYFGAIDLKDLIIAREDTELESIIQKSYPFLYDKEIISECVERIKDYAEDSLPVINEKQQFLGIITEQNVIEVVDEEMGDDYAKLAGLTAEEDLKETLLDSMKKRLPWLIALFLLGIAVSSVVGIFEGVVAVLPIVICFQSLILGMAGNVGTQSLAVTIRVLMDENIKGSQKVKLVFKEIRVGFFNGLSLGILTFIFVGFYIAILKHTSFPYAFLISACVGFSLNVAMIISSLVGTVVPMFFHKLHVDPAVASGPLITTVNDLVAVITYYGLAWILLIEVLHIV